MTKKYEIKKYVTGTIDEIDHCIYGHTFVSHVMFEINRDWDVIRYRKSFEEAMNDLEMFCEGNDIIEIQ